MKVCVIQPPYSFDEKKLDDCTRALFGLLDECDDSMDVIVLPEYSDALADVWGGMGFHAAYERNNAAVLQKAMETAKRCHSLVFVNAGYQTEVGIRNTTYVIDRNGVVIGRYFKRHPAPSELKNDDIEKYKPDAAYSYELNSPYILEIEGVRFGFLTCYDFYFYEYFAKLARENVDAPDLSKGTNVDRLFVFEASTDELRDASYDALMKELCNGPFAPYDRHIQVNRI